jgi:hypothetical protein
MNIKISGIAAGIAFAFSLLIGLVSGAGISALIRAFVFAVIFFAMSGGAYWLIYRFLPELFEAPEHSDKVPPAGSTVDISLEEESETLLQGLEPEENETEAEHSEPSLQEDPSGLDQTDDNGYTNEGAMNESPAHSAPESEAAEPADELPDLDSLSAAFSPGGGKKSGGELSEFTISSDSSIGGKSAGSNKAGSLADDFSTHDMASAIQTILKRE